jgi:hypothetical protein
MTYSRETACQLASDIVRIPMRASERPPRVNGLRRGEVWETRYGVVEIIDGAERYAVWLRYIGG